jgi:hypothetical protein
LASGPKQPWRGHPITGVLIALDEAPVSTCGSLDVDRDGRVTIDELVQAVQAALDGCSA